MGVFSTAKDNLVKTGICDIALDGFIEWSVSFRIRIPR